MASRRRAAQAALQRFAAELPPLNLQQPVDWSAPIADYLRAYRLNFAERQPGLRQYLGSLHSGDYRLIAQVFLPEKARSTVFVCHGYLDHSGLFQPLIDALLKADHAVVIWDLPGHGLSSGEQTGIRDFADYTAGLKTLMQHLSGSRPALPQPWHGLGQSTGGSIVMDYLLTEAQPAFCGTVLLAPLLYPVQWRWVSLQYRFARRFRRQLKRVKRVFTDNADNPEFLHFVRHADPLQSRWMAVSWIGAMLTWAARFQQLPPSPQPVCLIQGDADGTVDWRYNLPCIQRRFPNTAITMIPGAGHHLINEREDRRTFIFQTLLTALHEAERRCAP